MSTHHNTNLNAKQVVIPPPGAVNTTVPITGTTTAQTEKHGGALGKLKSIFRHKNENQPIQQQALPTTTAPLSSAPITTAPVTTAPLTSTQQSVPVSTVPSQRAQDPLLLNKTNQTNLAQPQTVVTTVQQAPLSSAPITTAPLTTAPIASAPIQSLPVQSQTISSSKVITESAPKAEIAITTVEQQIVQPVPLTAPLIKPIEQQVDLTTVPTINDLSPSAKEVKSKALEEFATKKQEMDYVHDRKVSLQHEVLPMLHNELIEKTEKLNEEHFVQSCYKESVVPQIQEEFMIKKHELDVEHHEKELLHPKMQQLQAEFMLKRQQLEQEHKEKDSLKPKLEQLQIEFLERKKLLDQEKEEQLVMKTFVMPQVQGELIEKVKERQHEQELREEMKPTLHQVQEEFLTKLAVTKVEHAIQKKASIARKEDLDENIVEAKSELLREIEHKVPHTSGAIVTQDDLDKDAFQHKNQALNELKELRAEFDGEIEPATQGSVVDTITEIVGNVKDSATSAISSAIHSVSDAIASVTSDTSDNNNL